MRDLFLAIQFLTIIPLPVKTKGIEEKQFSGCIIYFPLVGLLVAIFLIGLNMLSSFFMINPLLASTFLVVALIVLTGALHLDGLADTVDALASGADREKGLEIMRDPHIGAMGVLGLFSVILLKITLFFSLSAYVKNIALLLMCVLSRWSLLLPILLFPYAREQGKAKVFFGNLSLKRFILISLCTFLVVGLIWKVRGALIFLGVAAFTYLFAKFIYKKIGGMTGDTLGAILEVNEVLVLLGCFIFAVIK